MTSITVNAKLHAVALAGKSGKISKGSTNAANLVNAMTQSGIVGAALSAKGAIGKAAQQALSAHVVTLGNLLCLPALDGGQWGNLLALLVGEFGIGTYNAATMRGKAGCASYCAVTRAAFTLAFDLADTAKAQERAIVNTQAIDAVTRDVSRLVAQSEAARMEADTARALLDSGLTNEATNEATSEA